MEETTALSSPLPARHHHHHQPPRTPSSPQSSSPCRSPADTPSSSAFRSSDSQHYLNNANNNFLSESDLSSFHQHFQQHYYNHHYSHSGFGSSAGPTAGTSTLSSALQAAAAAVSSSNSSSPGPVGVAGFSPVSSSSTSNKYGAKTITPTHSPAAWHTTPPTMKGKQAIPLFPALQRTAFFSIVVAENNTYHSVKNDFEVQFASAQVLHNFFL